MYEDINIYIYIFVCSNRPINGIQPTTIKSRLVNLLTNYKPGQRIESLEARLTWDQLGQEDRRCDEQVHQTEAEDRSACSEVLRELAYYEE